MKIDFLEFIIQLNKLRGIDPNLIAIIFTLMMEKDYLTQDQLIKFTGLNRTTVSEAVNKLLSLDSKITILQTRKPNDRRKYYYCPYSVKEFVKYQFYSSLKLSKATVDFIPNLINRINNLPPEEFKQAKQFQYILKFYLTTLQFFNEFIEKSKEILDKYYDGEMGISLKKTINLGKFDYKSIPSNDEVSTVKEDSLIKIQQDFIRTMQSSSDLVIGKKELIAVFLSLYIEPPTRPLTQEKIIKLTGYSRSIVSESLSFLSSLNYVQTVKLPNSRKKGYLPSVPIEKYSLIKFQHHKNFLNKLKTVINDVFLPKLSLIQPSSEKDKFEEFLKEVLAAYGIIDNFLSDILAVLLEKINSLSI